VILNNIINQGYKLMDVVITNINTANEIYYLAKPWISSSSELDEADASQMTIIGYPNPTNSAISLEIKFKQGYEPKEIVLINEAGFIIYTKKLEHIKNGESVSIDLSNQKSGLYLITAKNSASFSPLIKVVRN
jgi:hypothetical protein